MATLYYAAQFASTTLSVAGGIDDSQTTGIILADIPTTVDADKPGIVCLNWADPLSTDTAEYISYTSIDGSKELQGVTRGAEDFSAKAHNNGVSVVWVVSKNHINNLNDEVLDIEDAVTNSFGFYNSSLSRQAIINSNFDIWQKGSDQKKLANVAGTKENKFEITIIGNYSSAYNFLSGLEKLTQFNNVYTLSINLSENKVTAIIGGASYNRGGQ